MGTSSSYGGSKKKPWKDARQQILDLPSGGGGGGPDSGNSPPGLDDLLDNLWGTIGDALDSDDPSLHAPTIDEPSISIPTLLPWLRPTSGGPSTGSSGGAGGGTGGGGVRTGGGRQGAGSKRQVTRSAARGGTVLGAAHAVRQGDAGYLSELGLDLGRLQTLSVARQCGEILDAVLGEGGHPDEAALRKASLESMKEILSAQDEPELAGSVETFVANFVFELALVELQAQVSNGAISPGDVARQEQTIRSYLNRRVKTAGLPTSGVLQPRELRGHTAKLTKEVVKVLRARSGGSE